MPQRWVQVRVGVTAFFLIALLFTLSLQAQKPDVAQLMKSGSQKVQAGDLDGAITDFRQASALQPSDPNVLFALAQALGDQGALAESEQTYLKLFPIYDQLQIRGVASGLTYKPSMAMAWNNLAAVYCRDNRFEDARAALDHAFAAWTSPANAPAQFFVTRGMVLEGLKQPNPAVQAYLTAIQKDPRNSDAFLDLGTLLLAQSRTDDALKVLQKGVIVSPGDGDMFAALGNALAKKDSWNEAATAYGKSLAIRPDRADIMFNLATSLEHLGKTSESVEVLRRAHQLAPGDAAVSASLRAGLVKLGKKGAAESLITSAGGLPKNSDVWTGYTAATALSDENRKDEALALVNQVLASKPDFPEA